MTSPEFSVPDDGVISPLPSVADILRAVEPISDYADYSGGLPRITGDVARADGQDGISYFDISFCPGEAHETGIYTQDRVSIQTGNHDSGELITYVHVSDQGEIAAEASPKSLSEGLSEHEILALTLQRMPIVIVAAKQAHATRLEAHAEADGVMLAKREQLASSLDTLEPGPLEAVQDITATDIFADSEQPELGILLDTQDLAPRYKQQIGPNTHAYFSRGFKVKDNRNYVVGYVQHADNPPQAQLFYLSNSHGVWRWAPAKDPNNNGHICKGQDEQAMTLPRALQHSLHHILDTSDTSSGEPSKDILSQLVPDYDRTDPTTHPAASGAFMEYQLRPDLPFQQPDFENRIDAWEFDSDVYGHVFVDVFLSADGKYEYALGHNKDGLAWPLYAASTDPVVRSQGLVRDAYVSLEGLQANYGAYEYMNNVPPSLSRTYLPRSGSNLNYVNIFGAYLANVPLIANYYPTIPRVHIEWSNLLPPDVKLTSFYYRNVGRLSVVRQDPGLLHATVQLCEAAQQMEPAEQQALLGHQRYFESSIRQAIRDAHEGPATLTELYEIPVGSPAMAAFEAYLRLFEFETVGHATEKHDPDVTYETMRSPLYPTTEFVVARRKDGHILDCSVKMRPQSPLAP
jgi:hypothetical protein